MKQQEKIKKPPACEGWTRGKDGECGTVCSHSFRCPFEVPEDGDKQKKEIESQ